MRISRYEAKCPENDVPLPESWFPNTGVVVCIRHADGTDGISILEHHAPDGDSPPLHLHRTESEIFHVMEGEMLFHVGDCLLAPKQVPHTYSVEPRAGRAG